MKTPWIIINNQLCKSYSFNTFLDAFDFMSMVAIIAEEMNHHPWWSNEYNKVEIKLSTHDAGNMVTDLDYELAKKIDFILK
jgi:4a-hydroxytetrahydrobiopterin dehydratase